MPCDVVQCGGCSIVSCHVMSCHVMSCQVVSWDVMYCIVLYCIYAPAGRDQRRRISRLCQAHTTAEKSCQWGY